MIAEIKQVDGNPLPSLGDDELLVVLGPVRQAQRAQWVRELIQRAYPSLQKTHHYSRYHVGFDGDGGKKPYIVIEWTDTGVSALERRWVMGRLGKFISGKFSNKKIVLYLEEGAGSEQLIYVEDLISSHSTPLYDKSLWSFVKIWTPNAAALSECDPFRKARASRHWEFRYWVNENPDQLTSIEIGDRLAKFARETRCDFRSLDVPELTRLGMNLLLAVGQASERSPSRLHLVTHKYQPGSKPLLLIGKGITFDTGGINLKPHESHVNCMKNDMGGAGLTAQLFMALVESGYPGPLVLAIPACENLIDARSVKPGAIIKSHAGKSVLIEHTDAEGRLILADALSYCQKEYDPALTILAATLTTASLRQFTNFFTAVHFAKPGFQEALKAAGEKWGEEFTFWNDFLPFAQGNRTKAADLTNMGRMPSHASQGGSCNVAAHFLREFATKPMVHFDIFASTWNWSGDYPGAHYGATGAPFNSLFYALRSGSPDYLFGYRGG